MDTEKTLLKLSTQIDTIKAHINRLKKSNYNIHSLDVDMLKQKTYELYDLIYDLEDPQPTKEEVIVEDVKIEEKQVVETKVEQKKIDEPKIEEKPIIVKPETSQVVEKEIPAQVVEFVIEEPDQEEVVPPIVEKVPEPVVESIPEPEIESISEPDVEKSPVEETVPEPMNEEEAASTQQTNYDLFSGSSDNAIAERFQAKEETSIAEKMQKSHFSNIREAIGINEKFLFINELFNGDMGRYNKILDDINGLTTKQGVDTYLFELKIQFQWANDSEAYNRLVELCERKFN